MFQGINLQEVCNLIILISAVIVAGKTIYGFLKKPVDDLHDKAYNTEERHIESVIEQKMPELLKDHGEAVKNERKKETQDMMNSVKEGILEVLDDKIEELKEISLDQNRELMTIQKTVKQLNDSSMDVMRYDMNKIYYKYRPYKKILDCDKKAFIKFYTDYHEMGGNTWIDSLYKEVVTWEIVEDERELKIDN